MNPLFDTRGELKFGAPRSDQILLGNSFCAGFDKNQRHAKWTLELFGESNTIQIPKPHYLAGKFRTDTACSGRHGSGFAAIGSDVRKEKQPNVTQADLEVLNPDIFLLPYMSLRLQPMWKKLESAIKHLVAHDHVSEVYVLSLPVTYFELLDVRKRPVVKSDQVMNPVPHAYIKSVLAVDQENILHLWTFEFKNDSLSGDLEDYIVPTYDAEILANDQFWHLVDFKEFRKMKRETPKMWTFDVPNFPTGISAAAPHDGVANHMER